MTRHPQSLLITFAAAIQLASLAMVITMFGLLITHFCVAPVRTALGVMLAGLVISSIALAFLIQVIKCPACHKVCFSGNSPKENEGYVKSLRRTFLLKSFICPHCSQEFNLDEKTPTTK